MRSLGNVFQFTSAGTGDDITLVDYWHRNAQTVELFEQMKPEVQGKMSINIMSRTVIIILSVTLSL